MSESRKMTTQQDATGLWLTLTRRYQGEVRLRIHLPVEVWLALFRSLKASGRETTVAVAALGAMISHALMSPSENQQTEAQQVALVTTVINNAYDDIMKEWHDEEELVLDATYQALRKGLGDHFAAARTASMLLGIPVTATAWRLRVSRWAKKKGLDPVELPRGRSRKNKPADAG